MFVLGISKEILPGSVFDCFAKGSSTGGGFFKGFTGWLEVKRTYFDTWGV